jgi:hypothetical protein
MENPQNVFFFEIEPIPDEKILWKEFQQQNICFSYFQVDQRYYLFFYAQESIDIDQIDSLIQIIEELDRKQRQIRSLRGFFLYALEIMKNEKDLQILKTNLKSSFWRTLKSILRQNKKSVLIQFLFGTTETKLDIEEKIQILETQVNSLQQKLINLEVKLENSEYALSGTLEAPDTMKSIQLGDSTLKQNKAENESNFVTLSQISEEERVEIIKKGFQLNQQGLISLKKYYESTDPNSLFQSKRYSIKYESIRRTKLYQTLKE